MPSNIELVNQLESATNLDQAREHIISYLLQETDTATAVRILRLNIKEILTNIIRVSRTDPREQARTVVEFTAMTGNPLITAAYISLLREATGAKRAQIADLLQKVVDELKKPVV